MAERLLLATLCTALAIPAQADPWSPLRLWFSTEGVPEQEPIAGTPGEYIDYETGIVPVIDAADGDTRLYLWGTSPGTIFDLVTFEIHLHTLAGTAAFTDSHMYNFQAPYGERWGWIIQGTLTPDLVDAVQLNAFLGWGLTFQAFDYGDLQFDPGTDSMLLGYIDLALSPDARAEIYYAVEYGVGSQPPTDSVFYGWGDEPVSQSVEGTESALPDALIIPEPAPAMLLIILAAVALARARRRQPV